MMLNSRKSMPSLADADALPPRFRDMVEVSPMHSRCLSRSARRRSALLVCALLMGCATTPSSPPAVPAAATSESARTTPSPGTTPTRTGPGSPTATAAAADAAAGPGSPRPFAEVIKDAVEQAGVIGVWQKDDRVWLEIAPERLGKPFYLSASSTRGLGEGRLFGNLMVRGWLVEFRKVGTSIQLAAPNTRYHAPEGSPEARAVRASFADSILASAPIVSRPHPERKSVLVDASALFVLDLPGYATAIEAQYRLAYGFDSRNSSILVAKADAGALNLEVAAHYAIGRLPVPPATPVPAAARVRVPDTVPDGRSLLLGFHYSLVPLPEKPMTARAADDRIGHFVVQRSDYGRDFSAFPRTYSVVRWRLEKKDPVAPLSAPVTPITFWIDRSMPERYRDTVKAGVLEWNKAFEKIGFREALKVEVQPENASFNTADLRYSSIRWFYESSDNAIAVGPVRADPRSGEIIDADIAISEGWTRLTRRRVAESYPVKNSERDVHDHDQACEYANHAFSELAFAMDLLDARGDLDPKSPEAERLVQATLKDVVTHEVGHTLGLRHNYRASTIYPLDQLSDPEFTRVHGLGGSVMDYNAFNIPLANERAGEYVMSTLGPYDYWAIEYAYRPIPPEQEATELARIAARSIEPELAYASDEETGHSDPTSVARDLGSDPLAWAKRRVLLSKELLARSQVRTLAPGDSRAVLRRNYYTAIGGFDSAVDIALTYVGGAVQYRDHSGSARDNYVPVPAARQREALFLVTDTLFSLQGLGLSAEFLNRMPESALERGPRPPVPVEPYRNFGDSGRRVLGELLADETATALLENESRATGDGKPLRLSELHGILTGSIWAELKNAKDIPLDRRNLQREHVRLLAVTIVKSSPTVPADARSIARESARSLSGEIKVAAKARNLSPEARAHLADATATLDEALKAPLVRTGP
jgi:Met-zincin/Domain of unknown function (DUF5117)